MLPKLPNPNTEQANRGVRPVRSCSGVFGWSVLLLLIEQVFPAQCFETVDIILPALADFCGGLALNNHCADILHTRKFLKEWGKKLLAKARFVVGINNILKVKSRGYNLLTINVSKVYAVAEFILSGGFLAPAVLRGVKV